MLKNILLFMKKIFIKNKKKINILIHGNHTHLKALFNYGFEDAIKNYYKYLDDKNLDYNLIFFLDKLPNFYKMKLEKQKLHYDFIKYDYNKVGTIFSSADIAIVTSSTIDIKNESISISNFFKKEKIFFEDINLKFKNKSNFGRALLAMQNGLSVITDITPSNLSLYNYQKQNILFFINQHQLLDNLIKLTNYNFRKKISNNAYNSVKYFNFNSNEFVIKLIKYINNLILKNEINYKKNL